MARCCLVEGCYSTTRTKGVYLFHFPHSAELCTKWVEFTRCPSLIEYWENRQLMGKHIGSHCKMCHLHFRAEDFRNTVKIQLKPGTVPSLRRPPRLKLEVKPGINIDTYSPPLSETYEQPLSETFEQPLSETFEQPLSETFEQPLSESLPEEPFIDQSCAIKSTTSGDPCFPVNIFETPDPIIDPKKQIHLDSGALINPHTPLSSVGKRACLVEGCFATAATKGVRLFCFPTNRQKCLRWIEFTGSQTLLNIWKSNQTIPMRSRICSRHFWDEDYETEWKIKLKDGVIPSRNKFFTIKVKVEPDGV